MVGKIPAISLDGHDLRVLAHLSHELMARHDLTPLTQGKLDCLCGLYSIINAVRLLRQPIAPLSYPASRRLFEAGTDLLHKNGWLDAALVDGMVIRRWKSLAALITAQASTNTHTMSVETPMIPNGKLSAAAIERWIVEGLAAGMPVLMHLGQRHQHYTVVAGIDRQHISLFDSWGLVRIKRAGFVLRQDITSNCLMRFKLLHRIQP